MIQPDHTFDIIPGYFQPIADGLMRVWVVGKRSDFQVSQVILFREFAPAGWCYTNRICTARILHIAGFSEIGDQVVLSFELIEPKTYLKENIMNTDEPAAQRDTLAPLNPNQIPGPLKQELNRQKEKLIGMTGCGDCNVLCRISTKDGGCTITHEYVARVRYKSLTFENANEDMVVAVNATIRDVNKWRNRWLEPSPAKEEPIFSNTLERVLDAIKDHDEAHPDHGVGCACHDSFHRELLALVKHKGLSRKSRNNFAGVLSLVQGHL